MLLFQLTSTLGDPFSNFNCQRFDGRGTIRYTLMVVSINAKESSLSAVPSFSWSVVASAGLKLFPCVYMRIHRCG